MNAKAERCRQSRIDQNEEARLRPAPLARPRPRKAEAAASHYVKAIAGSAILGIEHYGKAGPGPEGSVMLVRFRPGGQEFLALNGGPLFTPNESVSFAIYCDDQAEVDRQWNHMSEGGKTGQCGWLKDRWGFSWQIVPRRFVDLMTSSSPDTKARVFGAMMQMTKFEIAKLELAAQGDGE